jgi:hypothetical protein
LRMKFSVFRVLMLSVDIFCQKVFNNLRVQKIYFFLVFGTMTKKK